MSRASSTPSPRSCRVRRHVFGRARDGYTTLACSSDLTVAERRELECFEFGETVEWSADPSGPDDLHFLLRPVAAGIALTRVSPGPPDPSKRATLLLHTLLFDRNEAALVASQLAALLRDPAFFEFEGGEAEPIELAIDTTPSASVRPDLLEITQTAQARRGACLIPLAQTSFSEIAGLVTQLYAQRGAIPRVVYRPGSDELECDVMVVDEHCRRGNGSQLRITYPDGRSESPRSSGRKSSGSNFDPRTVVIPKEVGNSANWTGLMENPKPKTEKALAAAQVATLLLVAVLVGLHLLADSRARKASEDDATRIAEIKGIVTDVRSKGSEAGGEIAALDVHFGEFTKSQTDVALALEKRNAELERQLVAVVQRLTAIERGIVESNGTDKREAETLVAIGKQFEALTKRADEREKLLDEALRGVKESLDTCKGNLHSLINLVSFKNGDPVGSNASDLPGKASLPATGNPSPKQPEKDEKKKGGGP